MLQCPTCKQTYHGRAAIELAHMSLRRVENDFAQGGANVCRMVSALTALAHLLTNQGSRKEAAELYRRALTIAEEKLGREHPTVATAMNNIAGTSSGLFYVTKAVRNDRLPSLVLLARYTTHSCLTCSIIRVGDAALLYSKGEYEEATPYLTRSLELREKTVGSDHLDVAQSLNNLGVLLNHQGKYEEARRHHERSLRIREQALGDSHPDVATSLNNLGELLRKQGLFSQAEPIYQVSFSP
eukprot:908376-Pyramimonas_sp.AAC.1